MVALFRKNKRNKHNRENSNDWKTDKVATLHEEAALEAQIKEMQAEMDRAQQRLAKVSGNTAAADKSPSPSYGKKNRDLLVYPQGGEDHDALNQKSILTPPSSFKMQVDTDNEYVPRTKKKKKSGLRKALRRTAALGPQVLLQIKKSKFLLKPTKTKYSRMTLMTAIRQRFWNVKTKTPQAEEEAESPAAREQRRGTSSPKYQVAVDNSTPPQEYQQPPVMEIMVPPEVEKSVCSSENSGKFRRELKNALQARSGGDGSNNDFPSDEDNYDAQYGHHLYNSGVCDDDISSVSWNRTWAGREDILIPATLANAETGTEDADPVDPTPVMDPSQPPAGAPAGSWTKVINNNTKLMTTIKEQEQELLPLPAPQEEDSPQRSCAVVRNNTRALVERLEKKNHTARSPPPKIPPKMTSPRRSFEYSRSPQVTVEKTSTTSKEDASLNKPTPPAPTRAPAKTMWSPKGSKKESDDHSVATTFSKELARKISNLKKSSTAAARVKTTTPPRSSFDSSTSKLSEARNGLRPTATTSSKTANKKKFEYSKSPPAEKPEGCAMKKQKTTTSVPPPKNNSDSARNSAESFSQAIARQRNVLKGTTSKTTVPSAKVDNACTSQPTLPSRATSSKKTFAANASPFGKKKAEVDPNTPPADDATIVSNRSGRSGRSAFRRELSAKFGAMFQKQAAATRGADDGKKEAEQPQPKQAPPPQQQPQQIQRSSSRRMLRPQDLLKQKSIVRKWDNFAAMEDNGTPAAPRRRTDVFASKKKKVVSSSGPPAAARPQDKRANLLADICNPKNALKATPASAGGNPKSAPSSKKVPPAPKEVKSRPKGNLMSEIMNKKLKPVSASSGNVRKQPHKQQQRRNTVASRPAAAPPSSGVVPKGKPHPMMAGASLKNGIGNTTAAPSKGDLMAGIRAGVKLNKVASPDKKAGVVGKSAGSRGHPAQSSSTARAPMSSSSSSPHMAALMAKLQSRKEKCL